MVWQKKHNESEEKLGKIVYLKTERKLRARRQSGDSIWNGLGIVGIIGWAVALPLIVGVLLGTYFDKRWPTAFSWTLAFMLAGVAIGGVAAWRWAKGESRGK